MVGTGGGRARRDRRALTRVVGIDVARCLALLGMMATHILSPVDSSGGIAWPQALAGGRASALFAVLAGVSLSLMTGGRVPHQGSRRLGDAAGLAARALVIGLVGLWLGQLDTRVAVILVYYAALFLLGLPFLGQSAGTLLALAAWWCVAAPVASHVVREAWGDRPATVPTPESLESFGATLGDLLLTGYYPALPWLTYLFAGMAIGRLDLRSTTVAVRVLLVGGATAVLAWVLSRVFTSVPEARTALVRSSDAGSWDEVVHRISFGMGGTTPTDSWWWLTVAAPHSATPLDLAHTTGTAALVIGAALLLSRAAAATRWTATAWATLFGAGAMTLTLYSLHVALLTPERWPEQTAANYARHVLLALVIGAAFAVAARRGPLESLTRLAAALARRAVLGNPSRPAERATDSRTP